METHDQDFCAWAERNARLIREGRLAEVDAENVADELEAMSGSQRRELFNRMTVLITHLLKWRYQPGCRSRSWTVTINHQRRQIELLLNESPSLRRLMPGMFEKAYRYARIDASDETCITVSVFPLACPYTIDEILSEDFLPETNGTL